MAWNKGRPTIERLLDSGELDQVQPSTDLAQRLLDEAGRHLESAHRIIEDDPGGAFQLGYDAARKSASALLEVQGLRATSRGGHIAVRDAIRDQFNGPQGLPVFGKFDRLRRERNDSEYPNLDRPGVTIDDANDCIAVATDLHERCDELIAREVLEPFRP